MKLPPSVISLGQLTLFSRMTHRVFLKFYIKLREGVKGQKLKAEFFRKIFIFFLGGGDNFSLSIFNDMSCFTVKVV